MSIVKLIGVPFSVGTRVETSYAMDQQNGPAAIRKMLANITRGYDIPLEFEDLGDLRAEATVPAVLETVRAAVQRVVARGEIPYLLGGVHTFTLGSLRALSQMGHEYSMLYLDAHPDLMPHAEINYGSAMFYALKEGVVDPKRLAYLGIRQIERPEQKIIEDNSIFHLKALEFEKLGAAQVVAKIRDLFPPPYYISLDLDVLSPHEAPGVGNPYPGGLHFREVLYILTELASQAVLGIELVQLSPLSDRNDETAALAAALILETSAAIAARVRKH